MELIEKPRQPRLGKGVVSLEVTDRAGKNRGGDGAYLRSQVVSLSHSYPLRVLVPERASASACRWIFPITFGGGLVEGDVIDIHYRVGPRSAALVTSQGSTKVYQCEGGAVSQQNFDYDVSADAFLAVLGDPVVCFANANFKQAQRVFMHNKSSLVLLDWMTAGRMALDELWNFNSYQSLVEVYVDEELALRDNQHLTDTPTLSLKHAMRDYQVMGTCVVLGTDLQHLVKHLKHLYARPHSIGEALRRDLVCSFSPLHVETSQGFVQGCYLRFLATSTTLAFSVVQEITRSLSDVLGGDPYARKY